LLQRIGFVFDNIDETNEWLSEVPENHEDEEVFGEDSDFTWCCRGSGVENIYG